MLARERAPAGRHLVGDRAQREQIGPGVAAVPQDLFGSKVAGGADEHAGHRRERRALRRCVRRQARDAEIENLGGPRPREEEILRLQVVMNEIGRVRGDQASRHVQHDATDVVGGQRPAREPVAQRLAVEQLHDDERPPVVHAHVEQPHDVGTVQRRGDAGFLNEPFHDAGLMLSAARDELHRDVTPKAYVGCAIHLSHPAARQERDDAVRADECPCGKGGIFGREVVDDEGERRGFEKAGRNRPRAHELVDVGLERRMFREELAAQALPIIGSGAEPHVVPLGEPAPGLIVHGHLAVSAHATATRARCSSRHSPSAATRRAPQQFPPR